MTEKILNKIKESFFTALISACILVIIILIVWIPIKIIPKIFSNGANYVATTLSSNFIPATSTTANNTATTNTQSTNKPTGNVSNQTITTSSKADLSIVLTSVGVINRNTKQFTPTNVIGMNDQAGIKFEIRNIGGSPTGTWTFKASLPSASTPIYNSDNQTSLNPNDRMEFTMGFDNPINTGINTAFISVDPSNYISESSESNNSISVPINVYGNYSNSYNTTYNPGTSYNTGTTYTWTSLTGDCSVLPSTVYTGSVVTWNVNASGGNGYFTYVWNGTDNLYSTDKNPTKIYYNSGTKTATVTISSLGFSITKQCTVNVVDQYNNNSNSDLSLSLIGVGTVDSSGQFIQNTQIPRGGNAAIKVKITNIGSTYSGTWSITGSMSPSLPGYTYKQDYQASIAPSANSEYTIVFGNPQITGDNTFNIQISPNGSDTNSSNNYLTANIRIY